MFPPDEAVSGDPLPADIADALDRAAARLGRFAGRVRHVGETGSTNDDVLRLAAAGAPEGTAVVADMQTAGRGRAGHTWFSPAGAGLYVSFLLRPGSGEGHRARGPAAVHLLTLAIGVALADALRVGTGLPVEIKWPNDLVVGRRKLGGILAEAVDIWSPAGHVTVGFGLNLHSTAYPPDVASRATSIEAELGRPPDRALILAESLAAIDRVCGELEHGRFGAILSRWQELAPSSRGTAVRWVTPGGERRAVTAGITEDGALLLQTEHGLERVLAGDILWT
ncbi:MAG: biotin--[acetyl-CoA-carboxylase] ligase [Vicinamibacterales bacterium]